MYDLYQVQKQSLLSAPDVTGGGVFCQLRPYKSSKISIVIVCIDRITLVERVSSITQVESQLSTRKRKISRFARANFIRVQRAFLHFDLLDF